MASPPRPGTTVPAVGIPVRYGSPQQAVEGSPTGGSPTNVVRITRDEVQQLASRFRVTEEQVLAVVRRTRGDREAMMSVLGSQQHVPRVDQARVEASEVMVQRNVIQISRQEIRSLSEMFGATENRVIEVMRQVRGDRDQALAILSQETNVGEDRSRALDREADEIQSFADMFGIPHFTVARVWEDCKGDRDIVLSRLEQLANEPKSTAPPREVGAGTISEPPELSSNDIEVIFEEERVAPARTRLPVAPGQQSTGDSTVRPRGQELLPAPPTA